MRHIGERVPRLHWQQSLTLISTIKNCQVIRYDDLQNEVLRHLGGSMLKIIFLSFLLGLLEKQRSCANVTLP